MKASRSSNSAIRAVGWVAAGAVGATVLTGIAFAANQGATGSSPQSAEFATAPSAVVAATPAPRPSAGPDQRGRGFGPDKNGEGPRRGFGMGRGPGRVLHGELVVKGKDGKFVTVRMQKGTVTSASSTSLTVKSEDGYVGTWVVNGDTRIKKNRSDASASGLVVGDVVMVRGQVSSGDATAEVVRALSADQAAKLKQKAEERRKNKQSPAAPPSSTDGAGFDDDLEIGL